ncbi:hypothetical protein LCGC14_2749380, partial [marine sediment metagenome]
MEQNQDGPKQTKEVQVCRYNDAKILVAKDEVVGMHFWTDRLLFAVSEMPPGGQSTL